VAYLPGKSEKTRAIKVSNLRDGTRNRDVFEHGAGVQTAQQRALV